MVWWMYNNQPTPEEIAKQKAEQLQDSIQKAQQNTIATKVIDSIDTDDQVTQLSDSLSIVKAQNQLGAFAYSATLPSAKEQETTYRK